MFKLLALSLITQFQKNFSTLGMNHLLQIQQIKNQINSWLGYKKYSMAFLLKQNIY